MRSKGKMLQTNDAAIPVTGQQEMKTKEPPGEEAKSLTEGPAGGAGVSKP